SIGRFVADERRIKQVLYNLVSNALKYTPTGGRAVLGASRDGDELTLWVSDTGSGINAEERALVFQRVKRGRTTARRHGAGLGLALVRSFVELHGGQVELESEVGVGTRVTCRIPALRQSGAGEDFRSAKQTA